MTKCSMVSVAGGWRFGRFRVYMCLYTGFILYIGLYNSGFRVSRLPLGFDSHIVILIRIEPSIFLIFATGACCATLYNKLSRIRG